MKCSLKDCFINILFIIFIAPSKGVEFPLFLETSSVIGEPMKCQQYKTELNRLEDLDLFPKDDYSETKLHKIVKKQMAVIGSKHFSKRSFTSPFGKDDDVNAEDSEKSYNMVNQIQILNPSKNFKNNLQDDQLLQGFLGKHKKINSPEPTSNTHIINIQLPEDTNTTSKTYKENSNTTGNRKLEFDTGNCEEKLKKKNHNTLKRFFRLPDKNDFRAYYEFETTSIGCIKLRHKRCPRGQFFSDKYLRCIRSNLKSNHQTSTNSKTTTNQKSKLDLEIERELQSKEASLFKRKKRHTMIYNYGRTAFPQGNPEEPDPSNEWLDMTQDSKIPSEFKPMKKPELKIYHLLGMDQPKGSNSFNKYQNLFDGWHSSNLENHRDIEIIKRPVKRQESKSHHARSFLIHINKKIGKDDESITENEENDNDEDEENDDEDEEDEEGEDEDEEVDDLTDLTQKQHPSSREILKDFFKSAKEAVTNRARFNEDPIESRILQKSTASFKSKKSDDNQDLDRKSKKVLIDANIKFDSAIGNALKCVLKGKSKGDQEISNRMATEDGALISDRGSQDQMDPELIRMYENLLRHNPRVKRYFMAKRKN